MRIVLALLLSLGAALHAGETDPLTASVVKVFAVQKGADYFQPWQMGYQVSVSGSGFIIKGHRIMTNAHVVSDQVNVQVMKAGDTRKFTAHVLFVANDADLALLTVDEPGFFDGTTPVTFGPMPRQRDHVAAYGFPAGGEEMSITEGVVSRIEVQPYAHSGSNLLSVQTDAAINPGSSGGPVFKDGKFVGISFQGYSGAALNNTGYFIPVVLVQRFLTDIADGHYDGVPLLGLAWQKLENPALRRMLGLKQPRGGVMVTKLIPGSGAAEMLKTKDVILALDGVPVAENGTIPFGDGERVDLSHLISLHQMSQTAKVTVWRDGQLLDLAVPLHPVPDLVPGPLYDQRPSYCVYAGLVFEALTANYLALFQGNANIQLRYLSELGLTSPERQQVVFINQVLPDQVNEGYHHLSQAIVTAVDDRPISQLKDVWAALKHPVTTPRGTFITVKLDHWAGSPDNRGSLIVLDAAAAAAAQDRILQAFGIPSATSADLADPTSPTAH